ncbi:MAG: flagellar basal body P-ring protein FlgI [Armatimonadota bacterium]
MRLPKAKAICQIALLLTACVAKAQTKPEVKPEVKPGEIPPAVIAAKAQKILQNDRIKSAMADGVECQLSSIGKFRGARSNTIVGYGLVVGLNGTGDTSVQVAQTLLANVLSRWGTAVDITKFKPKNIALVSVTAELPAFTAPGTKIDTLVQSVGDAKSLEGGVLLPTPLGTMFNNKDLYAMASGPVSTGGYKAGANGSSTQKNYPNVGRITNGADVQRTVPTTFVFEGHTLFFDLQLPDFTNAMRVADKVNTTMNGYHAKAVDAATVQIEFPASIDAVTATSQIESMTVMANTPAKVVINSRNGVIVAGGNIKIAPVMIAYGALRIKIDTTNSVSQPAPLSQGTTTPVSNSGADANEDTTQIAVIPPNVTVGDLAQILQALKLSAQDLISIFQELSRQGALKAQVEQS